MKKSKEDIELAKLLKEQIKPAPENEVTIIFLQIRNSIIHHLRNYSHSRLVLPNNPRHHCASHHHCRPFRSISNVHLFTRTHVLHSISTAKKRVKNQIISTKSHTIKNETDSYTTIDSSYGSSSVCL